jgi:ATP-dependent DNA helicase RecG
MQDSDIPSEFPFLPEVDPSIAAPPFQGLRADLIAHVRNHARLENPKHAWLNLEDADFLKKTGLVQADRSTGEWSATPAGILLFGTESSISEFFPELRTVIVHRDRPDGKRLEASTPLNLVETMQVLLKAVEPSFPNPDSKTEEDRASLRNQVFQTIFVDFIKKRDYLHASSAKLILNPEHLSLQFAQVPQLPASQSGEKSLNTALAGFMDALYPHVSTGIDSEKFRKTMQAYFGANPVVLRGSLFKFMALKPKKRLLSTYSAMQVASTAPATAHATGHSLASTAPELAWESKQTSAPIRKSDSSGLASSMQASPTKAFSASRSETAKIEWNAPKTVQVSRTAKILEYCKTPRYREEIQQHVGMNNRDHFRKEVLNPLIERGLLRPTIPDKPNSPKQQYETVPQ